MSFGGNQGTIRYATILDTAQAERSAQALKNTFTQLGVSSNTTSRNIAGLNQSFTAGVNPIKTQGNALTSLNTNLKANSTQVTSLGGKIKATASNFSTFAIGLSATTTSVLQLGAGFRDYNDAQIAVDRQTRRVSLAQEALGKANEKLNKLTSQGIKSGKDYRQAQLDVAQAQSFLKTQTELLGERQETLFDTQSQFIATVIPTTLGAVGTLGAAFKSLGGTGGIGGLTEKFKGLGSTLKGGLGLSNLTSLIGPLALAIGPLIIGLLAWESAQRKVATVTAEMDNAKHIENITTRINAMNKSLDKLKEPFDIPALNFLNKLGPGAGLQSKAVDIAKDINKQNQESLRVSNQLKAAQDKYNTALETYNNALKSKWQGDDTAAKAALGLAKADLEGVKAIAAKSKGTDDIIIASEKLKKSQADTAQSTKDLNSWTLQASALQGGTVKNLNLASGAYLDVHNAIVATNPAIQENIAKTTAAAAANIANTNAVKNATPALTEAQKFTKLFGDANVIAAEGIDEFIQKQKEQNDGMTEFEKAIQDGTTKFQAFVSQSELGAVTNKRYTDSLKEWVGQQIEINPALDLTTSQLESLQTALGKGQSDLSGMSEATKILADAFNSELTPSLQTFNSAITADKFKDFKNALKDLPGFGDFSKGAKKEFSNLINDMRHVADAAKEVGTDISAAILGAFEGVSGKSLGSVIKNLVKDVNEIGKIDIDATKFKPITDFLNNLTAENRSAGILKIKDSLALMQDAMADGVITAEEAKSVMAKFAEETGKTVDPANKSAAAIKAFGVSSASARGQIDAVTGAIDVLKGQAEKLKPKITVNTDPALDAIGELKRGWDKVASQIEKKIPKINANTDKALDMIGELKRGWDKVAGQIEKKVPKIKVNADQALDMIGEVKRGMDSIKDKSVSIKVGVTGAGASKFDSGGSKENSGPTTMSVQSSKANSGGTGGETFLFNLHFGDKEIVRKVKRELGTNRYTLG